jgi:predicted SAM-dependent methyltransferase
MEALARRGVRSTVRPYVTRRYIASHPIRKLHLGCGNRLIPGWLNSDAYVPLFPLTKPLAMIELDATKRFPLPDDTFDYAFSEHMIEHIPYRDGQTMLRECLRVLKPGGMIRIATPDFRFLLRLYDDHSDVVTRYIQWSGTEYGIRPTSGLSVINNFVRDWGHQFIYDSATLQKVLGEVGFQSIRQVAIGASAATDLCDLENQQHRMEQQFYELETMVLEAAKPGAA